MAKIKRKDIYELEKPVAPADYVIGTVDSTGETKNFEINDIASTVGDIIGLTSNFTGVISVEDLIPGTGVVDVINALYKVNGTQLGPVSQLLSITPASEGFRRIDIILGSESTELSVIEGEENESNPAQPATPVGYALISVVNVYGSEINPEVPPAADVMLKSNEGQYILTSVGIISSVLWNSKNTYRWIGDRGSTITLSSLHISDETSGFLYDGRLFTFVNDGGGGVATLKHNAVGTTMPFYMPNYRDLVVPLNYIAVFKYSSYRGRLDFVSLSIADANGVAYYNPAYPSLNTVQLALDSVLYVAPDITSFTNNIGSVEKGTVVTSVVLNWTLNKTMTTLFLNNGIGAITPTLLTYTHNGQSITTNRTYSLTAGDGTGSDVASTTISFLDKRYWGTSPNTTLTSAEIIALSGSELSSSRLQTKTINGGGDYIYLSFPVSFGLPSFIVNGLPNTAWTITTQSFTNASGATSNYYVCRTNTIQFGSLTIQVV